jgi:hypothetical protein
MEVAERSVELLRRRGRRRRVSDAVAQIECDQQDGDSGEGEEAGNHEKSEANETPQL